jgi:hypothetical protein
MHFMVDAHQLKDVSRRLTSAVDVADEVKNDRDALKSHLDDPGDDRFGSAASEFLDEWSYGCGCMTEDATALSDLLGQASTAYLEVEGAITEAFTITDG